VFQGRSARAEDRCRGSVSSRRFDLAMRVIQVEIDKRNGFVEGAKNTILAYDN